ncbi:MAG: response regulator transcription factor [Desulfobulbaceae bacterium]|nr:response regulator transcription factor [Desulfobulbaceae bacterium]
MNKIRVLIVDDHNIVREGVAAILACQSDMEVVGQAKDGVEAIEILKTVTPDVILLDLVMPRKDGFETIPDIKKIMPEAHILILTSFAENERVYQAIKLGAEGYMLKDATYTQLLQGIRDVAAGEASIYPSIAMRVIREIKNPTELMFTTDPLTPREMDTLRNIANGLSNQEIAEKLYVQERTVAKYVSNILTKLQLANRTQAALYAMKKGITTS